MYNYYYFFVYKTRRYYIVNTRILIVKFYYRSRVIDVLDFCGRGGACILYDIAMILPPYITGDLHGFLQVCASARLLY